VSRFWKLRNAARIPHGPLCFCPDCHRGREQSVLNERAEVRERHEAWTDDDVADRVDEYEHERLGQCIPAWRAS
jgi:hypothetical protein